MCQLCHLNKISQPLGFTNKTFQRRNRLKRIFKRRWHFVKNVLSGITSQKKNATSEIENNSITNDLKSGDTVRVKSRKEIQSTLNHWNQLKGCAFMEEMWIYCGTSQRVFKKINIFLDERDYLMKKCNGIFILDGVICEGTNDFGPCDRSCFIFWRREWLEKIDQ